MLRPLSSSLAIALVAALPLGAQAQTPGSGNPAYTGPTLTLDAEATQRVPEDTAWASFSVEKESANQADAQKAGQAALSEVMAVIKKVPALETSTENLFTQPVYNKEGKITSWRTNFSVRFESTDTAQVAKTMGELIGKARLSGSGSSLSDAAQKKVQEQLIGKAVKAFEAKAQATASAMGFKSYEYGNVAINQSGAMPMPRNSVTMFSVGVASAKSAAGDAMGIEPGQTQVAVQISGTVKLVK